MQKIEKVPKIGIKLQKIIKIGGIFKQNNNFLLIEEGLLF